MSESTNGGEKAAARTERLRARARAAGFDRIGVAAAAPLDRDARALEDWLARGRQAGMGWMARASARRADPAAILPGCRAVVALAANYGPGDGEHGAGRGRVARYARARDYHRVLGRKLIELAAWLEHDSGCASRAFVDTGPVLERAWAERAGVGWIGKNANVLTREFGSWLLLGEILTRAPLVPDPGPHAEFCGSCTACLDACPTGAIVADGVVDSNLCISYWTIEHRGSIPHERRAGLGEWIFGCDVCQEVCPWNASFAQPADPAALERREELARLDAEELLGLDETEFRARFSGTALMRARWDGMRRNACVVLGNARATSSVPALSAALDDDDPLVRGHAAWALGRIGGPRAHDALERAHRREPDPTVREELRRALETAASVR